MEVAGFIIAIFALVIGILALVLSMRALYIIGVNAGLDKQFDPKSNTVPTPAEVKIDTKKVADHLVKLCRNIYTNILLLSSFLDFLAKI